MSEEMMQTSPFECPAWFDGKKINETVFCEEFLRDYPMVTVNDAFFTVNGRVHDENRLKKVIYEVSSKDLYAVYKLWCDDNALSSLSQKSFCSFLKQNESRYNIEYTNKVNIGGGRYARGFVGIELLQRPFL